MKKLVKKTLAGLFSAAVVFGTVPSEVSAGVTIGYIGTDESQGGDQAVNTLVSVEGVLPATVDAEGNLTVTDGVYNMKVQAPAGAVALNAEGGISIEASGTAPDLSALNGDLSGRLYYVPKDALVENVCAAAMKAEVTGFALEPDETGAALLAAYTGGQGEQQALDLSEGDLLLVTGETRISQSESTTPAETESEMTMPAETGSDTEPASPAGTESEPETENETVTPAESEFQTELESEAAESAENESETELQSEPGTETTAPAETEPEFQSESEPESEGTAPAETESGLSSESELESESAAPVETGSGLSSESEPESESAAPAETESELSSESEPESESAAPVETESGLSSEGGPESESAAPAETGSELSSESELESETADASGTESESQPESETSAPIEIEVETENETAAPAEMESETEPETEAAEPAGTEAETGSETAAPEEAESETEPETESERVESETEAMTEGTELQYEDSEVAVQVTVAAGVDLPEGTVVVVKKLEEGTPEYEETKALIAANADVTDETVYTFYDVTLEADGTEIETEEGSVSIQLQFKNLETDEDMEQSVLRIEDTQEGRIVSDMTAQAEEGISESSLTFEY